MQLSPPYILLTVVINGEIRVVPGQHADLHLTMRRDLEIIVQEFKHLKAITATYRMTIKGPPVRHSPYVSGLLRPVKVTIFPQRIIINIFTSFG